MCYDGQNFCSSINNTNSELVTSDTYIAQVLANEWHGSSTLEAYRAGAIAVRTFVVRELGCGAWIRAATESAPITTSNLVSNLSQKYRLTDNINGDKNGISSTHQ